MKRVDAKLVWSAKAPFGRTTFYEDLIPQLDCYDPAEIKSLPKEERIKRAGELVQLIRSVNVFPIYYLSDEAIVSEILDCMLTDVRFYGDTLDVHESAGNVLLDYMFPSMHLANAKGSANNSMYDRFFDDRKLSKCLYSYMAAYKFKSVRTMFFMYGRLHWPTATSFSPMRAKAIYERFCDDDFVVYDSSAGFGGRMLGAMTCSKRLKYVCCEPSTDTYNGLLKLHEEVKRTQRLFGMPESVAEIHKEGSEVFCPEAASVDFAFTCPPYFKLETYCNEATQSTIKFKKYDAWLEGFVRPTVRSTYTALKPGATACVVLGNVRDSNNKMYYLIDDWTRIAEEEGFVGTGRLEIATRSRKAPGDAECILMFRKEYSYASV